MWIAWLGEYHALEKITKYLWHEKEVKETNSLREHEVCLPSQPHDLSAFG